MLAVLQARRLVEGWTALSGPEQRQELQVLPRQAQSRELEVLQARRAGMAQQAIPVLGAFLGLQDAGGHRAWDAPPEVRPYQGDLAGSASRRFPPTRHRRSGRISREFPDEACRLFYPRGDRGSHAFHRRVAKE